MHNSGVALLRNDEVLFAIDEERFTRKKNEGAFPLQSLSALYRETGISPEMITSLAMPDKNSIWQLLQTLKYASKTYLKTGLFLNNYLRESFCRLKEIKRHLPNNLAHTKRFFVEHHLAHASSAYYTSPWSDACIVTIDGMGDFCMSGLTAVGESGKIKVIDRLNGFYSPGLYYMIITEILGFVSGRHEGKVTGLAAYGQYNSALDKTFKNFIHYDYQKSDFFSKNIPFEINDYISRKWVNGFNPEFGSNSFDEKIYEQQKPFQLLSFRVPLANFSKEDIAFAAQKRLEEIVLAHVSQAIKKTNKRNLVLAGGVFANVRLNQKIQELQGINKVYVYPAMNDSGLSVGSALYVYYNKCKNQFVPKGPSNVYLGISFKDDEIEKNLVRHKLTYSKKTDIELEIAKSISEGKIVAHFYGKSEFGPRALGNRSILAPAVDKSINQLLNGKLKRTEFMPFAPVILEDYAKDLIVAWDKDSLNARFMTMTYQVTKLLEQRAPAVVHVDRTARPQVISKSDNPRLYKILSYYYQITGIPVLVNTSFNLHEEPIVNTPEDALKIIKRKVVDVLTINDFWIE